MIDTTKRKHFGRTFRHRQQQLEDLSQQTEASIDQHFFRRLGRLYDVRRFVIGWVLLFVLLIGGTVMQTRALGTYYQTLKPIAGGIYTEGLVGSFTNANPLFANNDTDLAVSRLLFPGLLKYDGNNQLVGDLADSWSVDASNKVYTVSIRKNLKWQDGEPITSEDVAFTFNTIQNPDVRSPYFAGWQGVVVKIVDPQTVSFTLPNIYAPFLHSLTLGIVPKHTLRDVSASGLRSSLFNTAQPVGSGPFKWSFVEVRGDTVDEHVQRIVFVPNKNYYATVPRLNEFIITTFLDEGKMQASFKKGELTAMSGVDSIDNDLASRNDVTVHNIPLFGAVMVFLRTDQETLKDATVRKALIMATNQNDIIKSLAYPSLPVHGPFLESHVGYNAGVRQFDFSPENANLLLDKAGWAKGNNGIREKGGKKLELTLNTLNKAEYASVAGVLQKQWRDVGVQLNVGSLADRDLQAAIDNRDNGTYDALLYGISMGADSDQFAYWHSTQADILSPQRLNFSDYKSPVVDQALEAGRTRLDPQLRSIKYRPFVDAWRNDVPAIALYQPRLLYVTRGPVNLDISKQLVSPADRLNNVNTWTVRVRRSTN